MSGYKIGALAERTRTNTPAVRHYEPIGLLRRPDREDGNQRRYGDLSVSRPAEHHSCCGTAAGTARA